MAKVEPVALIAKDSITKQIIATLSIDATVNETHTMASTITDHPVETGVNVSDHSRPDPDTLQLECIISNTPLSRAAYYRAVSERATNLRGLITTSGQTQPSDVQAATLGETTPVSDTTPIGEVKGRANRAYALLKSWRDSGQLVDVATSLRAYTSMGITSVSVPRDAKTSDALHFTLQLKYVRFVENRLSRQRVAKSSQAKPKVSTGAVTPVPETPESPLHVTVEAVKSGTKSVGKMFSGAADSLSLPVPP